HRFPDHHPHLPWEAFLSRCDLAMPQVYWVKGDPARDLQASWEEYQRRWPHLPYVPIGAAYGEGDWSASPDEITRFLQKARALNLPAVSFWSWQNARNDPDNPFWSGTQLWEAIAAFRWPIEVTPTPVRERPVWVVAPLGLKFRSQPSTDDAYWLDRIVFTPGTQLTALGDPTPPDARTYRWQRVRAPDGREGWVAYGIGDEVYLSDQAPEAREERERPVWVVAPLGLKFRSQPSTHDAFWIDQTVFLPGTQLTALGDPTPADARTYRWQRVRAPDGREGWVAYSIGREVYLSDRPPEAPPVERPKPERTVWVTAPLGLKFRRQPIVSNRYWIDEIVFLPGTKLTALGTPTPKDAQGYRWQRVRAPDGREGWVAYSWGDEVYLSDRRPRTRARVRPPEGPERTVWVTATAGLKLRRQPSTDDTFWIRQIVLPPGTRLTAIGDPTSPDSLGYRWQYVRTAEGRKGWVAYSFGDEVYLSSQPPAPSVIREPAERTETVWSTVWLNLRAAPSTVGRRLWTVADGIPLTVLEDPEKAAAKVGVEGEWLRVRTPSLKEGYVAAWLVQADRPPDTRQPVRQVPPGESPYLFGIHDPYDRGLFAGSGKTGWVLFTEAVGANPRGAGGNRTQYYDWSRAGFGVIARLNFGYESSGTIPDPPLYDAFAATCARWVERSMDPNDPRHGCHIWIIGNEMNNPREWPGNQNGVGGREITPQNYARCFNRVYAAIKAVQPNAIVCPGAVDPYYGPGSDCGRWFREMLAYIVALDGIALHAYTHGTDPDLITSRETFQGAPLSWQYYHFYAYRTFMEMIPGRWRHVPVFITETDQVQPWADVNSGWVRRAYAEVHRWNQTPHHQQIRALLLYRWSRLDRWWIEGKRGVIEDFKAALRRDYRWRR
ncbi:MAG: SH3 domain-containing protein, partial [Chloroflexi bacterium]